MNLRFAALPMAAAALLSAQTALVNDGKPMRVAFQCSADDMNAAGLTCPPEQPCPVYLELNGFQAAGQRLFASGDLHTRTATLYSVLLASADAGRTWTEPYPRESAVTLDQMQFIDLEYGWISGETTQPLSRDPFLLMTSDGGKSWKKQPIFEEEHSGSIEKFRFDSRNGGDLLIDTGAGMRYQLYETKTGGMNWTMLHESADPVPFPASRGDGGTPAWRLRADANTHSYQIEKIEGERWIPIASFLVEVGSCHE